MSGPGLGDRIRALTHDVEMYDMLGAVMGMADEADKMEEDLSTARAQVQNVKRLAVKLDMYTLRIMGGPCNQESQQINRIVDRIYMALNGDPDA